MIMTISHPAGSGADCQECGACCSFSSHWPRFTTEDDAALKRIPAEYVSNDERGMRCDNDRCAALTGEVGARSACAIYEVRPDVCRACTPGEVDCGMARRRFGLPEIISASAG